MNPSSKRTTTYKQRRRVKISGYTRKTGVKVRPYTARRIKKVTRTITLKPRKPPKAAVTKATTKRVNIRHHYRQITWINGKIAKNQKWKPTRKMYRISLAINYVIHGTYQSYRIQSWAKKPSDFNIENLKEQLKQGLEKELGYKEALWWFETKIGIEQPTKVTYNKNLIGTVESENEKVRETIIMKNKTITKYFPEKKQK